MVKFQTINFKYSWPLIVVLFGLFTPLVAYGALVGCTALGCTLKDLLAVPVRIYNMMMGMAGVVFLAVIIWAGIRMVVYYMSESPEAELMAAKMTLSRGIMGILIIALAYTAVNLFLLVTVLDVARNTILGKLLISFGLLL